MKAILKQTGLFALLLLLLNSCSTDDKEVVSPDIQSKLSLTYTYNETEIEAMNLINEYRESVGLKSLEVTDYASIKSEEHNEYMITNKVVSHNGFTDRCADIISVLTCKRVGENLAYNFKTCEAVLKAWLASPGHKENIVGNYTHFGIAITEDPETGKKYFTNMFVKM